jgi:hypothetical protein
MSGRAACSICQHGTEHNYHKVLMGGIPGAVCWYCFVAWYEGGLVTDEAIRRASITDRHREGALTERAV